MTSTWLRLLTLRYCPRLGAIDDAPLRALGDEHEVLGFREHFFVVDQVPHLLCVVRVRPHDAVAEPDLDEPTAAPPHPPAAVEPAGPARTAPRLRASTPEHDALRTALRRWRAAAAQEQGVPAYVVLTNRDIDTLVHERPETLTALGRVRGIGKAKLSRYGEALLALLGGESIRADPPRLDSPATATADASSAGMAAPAGIRLPDLPVPLTPVSTDAPAPTPDEATAP